MQSYLNSTNIFTAVERAEINHRMHYPSHLGYRTALVLPGWSEMLKEMRACVVPAFSELADMPILSIAVGAKFFDNFELNEDVAFRALLCSVKESLQKSSVLLCHALSR